MSVKLRAATKWLSWLCVLLSLVFVVCGLAAPLEWFERETADTMVWFSAYAIFAVAAVLIVCVVVERGRD